MFIETDLETVLSHLNKLTSETKPAWGKMSAQRMVEHLTDTIQIATGEAPQTLIIPEDKVERMVAFLYTDKPMAQDMQVPFAKEGTPLRHEELELAIDEFVENYLEFQELFAQNPDLTTVHAYYGPLNYEQWDLLNKKHLTHHFTQFGIL
jgi:oxepin-CoA hydrolase/3-oxo-5,6-dehydrosuberyl-CoA semialdehyde dehydrogenase